MLPTVKPTSKVLFLGLISLIFQVCLGNEGSNPIVDVRFDAPYRQILPSHGDEWAPTWGRGDVLFTANDDGNSFGGIAINAIAFGKLEGSDPYNLRGITVNAMREYSEPLQLGPEGAAWNTLSSYQLDDTRYRFDRCASVTELPAHSCLVISRDGGKTWDDAGMGRPVFTSSKFGSPSFISYRNSRLLLMGDESGGYVYAANYTGVSEGSDRYILGRVPKEKLAMSRATDWSFQRADLTWDADVEKARLAINQIGLGVDNANWKAMNAYSVDGTLYMFVTRCTYPAESNDPSRRHVWQHSSIIKSTDGGKTWARPSVQNLEQPMFPGRRFGTAYFVWYGKDGAASVDNADKYVYAVSNNGHFENGDDFVLGRVLRSKLPNLSPGDWSFFTRGDGMRDDSWTSTLHEAKPILTNPGRSGMAGMTYISDLRRYVMVSWFYKQPNFVAGIQKKDLSTVIEFFEAAKPWGPWTRVRTLESGMLGWYAPIIGQRFQKTVSTGTVTAFLYTTGLFTQPNGALDTSLYSLNYMPITLSTRPLKHSSPGFVGEL